MKRDTTVSCCLPRDQTGASDWFAFAAAPLPRQELIASQPSVHGFPGDFDTGDRKTGRIELADLHQHRSLIPIDVFTGQPSIPELGHHDSGNLHLPPGWRNTGQQVVDHPVMSEFDDHLVNYGVGSDCAADRGDRHVGWIHGDHVIFIERFTSWRPTPPVIVGTWLRSGSATMVWVGPSGFRAANSCPRCSSQTETKSLAGIDIVFICCIAGSFRA